MAWVRSPLCLGLVLGSALPARAQVSSPHAGVTLVDHGSTALAVVDLCAAGVSVRATRWGERKQTAAGWAQNVDAEVAINADFFDYPGWSVVVGRARGGGEDWPANAQLKEIRSYWQFGLNLAGLEPNAAVPPAAAPWVTDIVGGHNVLISNGAGLGPLYDGDGVLQGAHRRTAVGLSADKRKLYLFASNDALNGDGIVWNMVVHANEAGAPPIHWATNMDGGGSSQLYVKGVGSVIGSTRQVNNHLGIYAKGVGPAWNCSCVPEACNGLDDDCNGVVDDGLAQQCGTDVGVCEYGSQTCQNGAWGECTGGIIPTTEACNELDDDCDGDADESEVCELEEAWQAALFDPDTSSDVDGDGRADACALAENGIECLAGSGTGFAPAVALPVADADLATPSVFSTLRTGDVTGDGRAEVCLRTASGIHCWLGTSHGLGKRFEGPRLSDSEGFDQARYFSSIRLADVTGDERLDLCVRASDGLRCHPSQGKGFSAPVLLPALGDAAGFSDVNRYGTIRFGDIDGDGRVDVCARSADGMSCWRSNQNGFSERVLGPAWSDANGFSSWQRWSTIRLADIDGDGRADLCARQDESFACYLFDGSGFSRKVTGPPLPNAEGWELRQHFGTLRLGDIDGDGKADLCGKNESGVTCWLFGASGFDRRVQGPGLADTDGWALAARYRTLRLADVNADQRLDLCARSAAGFGCWLSQGGAFSHQFAASAWSDDAGFSQGRHYHTIRLAGAGLVTNVPDESEASASDDAENGCSCELGAANRSLWPVMLAFAVMGLARRRTKSIVACGAARSRAKPGHAIFAFGRLGGAGPPREHARPRGSIEPPLTR